jgi:hypothetical protein
LEISFETKELRDLCEDETLAAAKLGFAVAETLKNRLSDIRAAITIKDVLAGAPRLGVHNQVDCYYFALGDKYSLVVVASHVSPRNDINGATDWARVRRVCVMALEF